jgi:DNA-binding transcriptional regulator GbsR (MarR family)
MNNEAKQTIIELYSEFARIEGHPKSRGEIYAILFLADKPLCINDIMEELKISKGNVSMNLNKLEEKGFIRRVWIKGERKNYYVIADGFSSINNIVQKKHDLIVKSLSILDKLNKQNEDEELNKKIQCIKKMKYLYEQFKIVMDDIEKRIKKCNGDVMVK